MKFISFDLIFSYWIFIWFLFYYFKFIKYNPYLLLVLALLSNIYSFVMLIYYKNYYKAILFLIVNLLIKVLPIYLLIKALPIYLLKDTKIKKEDIYFSIIFVLVYIFYVYLRGYKLNQIYDKEGLKSKNIDTPLMYLIDNFIRYIKNKKY